MSDGNGNGNGNGNGHDDATEYVYEGEPADGAEEVKLPATEGRKILIIMEACGRQLVGYVEWNDVGECPRRNEHGEVRVYGPLELRTGMMQDAMGRQAFGSEIRPLINTDWTPEITCTTSDWRPVGPRLEANYLRDLRRFIETYTQSERQFARERAGQSRIRPAQSVSAEEIAAAAALQRMRAGGRA